MAILQVEHLTKDYGGGKGIFDLSFSIEKGEVFGFLGPNGAGKTTTIRPWTQRPRQSPCRRVWTDRAMAGRSRGLLKPAGLAGLFLWDRHRRTTRFGNL